MRDFLKGAAIYAMFGLVMLGATALAGASSDRLRNTVLVGDGTSSTKTITFDVGNGASNPLISGNSSNQVGINNTSPGANLGVSDQSGSADTTNFMTRAGTITGLQRWKLLPSSGSTPAFEIDADHSGAGSMLIQSDSASILTLKHNGDVAVPQGSLSVFQNITGDAIGVNTTSPGFPLDVYGTGADVTTFATHAGTATGIERWKFMPSSGSTPRFEIDADFSGSNALEFQSDIATPLVLTRSGSASFNGALTVAGDLTESGVANLNGGFNTNGNGTVKIKTFTGSSTSNAGGVVALSVPGTLLGVFGFSDTNGTPFSSSTSSCNLAITTMDHAGGTFDVYNCTSGTKTYYAVAFYQ